MIALKPNQPIAHSGKVCEIEGTGHGEIDGDEVYVYEITWLAVCP
jgi:hypothetical protein